LIGIPVCIIHTRKRQRPELQLRDGLHVRVAQVGYQPFAQREQDAASRAA